MHKTSYRVAAWLLLGSMVCLGALGCSDSKVRRAGGNILRAAQEAQRRHDAAYALLTNPVYQDPATGQMSPLKVTPETPAADLEKIKLLPLSTLNPNALKAIEQAEKDLGAVMQQNPQADAVSQAIGHDVLSRLNSLKAHYHAARATGARDRAAEALLRADRTVALLSWQMGLSQYFEALLALSNEDIDGVLTEGKGQEARLSGAVSDAQRDLSAQEKRKADLIGQNERLLAEARDLRLKAGLTPGQEGLDLVNQGLAKEAVANTNATEIGKLEASIELLQDKKKMAEAELSAAKARVAAAEQVLASRRAVSGDTASKQDALRQSAQAAVQDLDKLGAGVNADLAEAKAAETEAMNAYDQANRQLRTARDLKGAATDADAQADEASILTAMGDLAARGLEVQQMASRVADETQKVLGDKAPESIKKMPSYIADPAQRADEAARNYKTAAGLYESAGRNVQGEHQWVYQGHAAAAYMALYGLRKDPGDLASAKAALNAALQNKEASPFLASIVRLKGLLPQDGGAE